MDFPPVSKSYWVFGSRYVVFGSRLPGVVTYPRWSLFLLAGLGPAYYSCDPNQCIGACHCPSLSPPGGLAPSEIPQFVLLTHDDAISALSNTVVRSVTDGHTNPNGCNVVATWFTTSDGTSCELAKRLWDENHEIALHTVSHSSLLPSFLGMEEEIMGARTVLEGCGIPKDEMVGFRSPYLVHNPQVRSILQKNSFLYDSSIIEHMGSHSSTSKNFEQRLWPYSMDNGIIQDCEWTAPAGMCTVNERYEGLWEVPLWTLLNDKLDKPNNGTRNAVCILPICHYKLTVLVALILQPIQWTLAVDLAVTSSQP